LISDQSWEFYKRTGTVASLFAAAMGVGVFFFTQNQRIGTLEAQMQALATRAITWDGSIDGPSDAKQGVQQPQRNGAERTSVAINPIAQVCADLALKLVENNKGGAIAALDPVANTMDRLNCKSFNK
jgi:hypothetical protein